MDIRCDGEITVFRGLCPLRRDCKFYNDYLNNLTTPFTQVALKKEKVGKELQMKCFKPK